MKTKLAGTLLFAFAIAMNSPAISKAADPQQDHGRGRGGPGQGGKAGPGNGGPGRGGPGNGGPGRGGPGNGGPGNGGPGRGGPGYGGPGNGGPGRGGPGYGGPGNGGPGRGGNHNWDPRRGPGWRPGQPGHGDWHHGDRWGQPGRHHGEIRYTSGRYWYRPIRAYNPAWRFRFGVYSGSWEFWITTDPWYRAHYYTGIRSWEIASTYLAQYGDDFDLVDVNDFTNCAQAVRLRVEGRDAVIDRIALHYTDGSSEELEISGYFPAGSGTTAWQDLSGWGRRCIDSVSFIGRTVGGGPYDQARISLWGIE